MPEPDSTRCRRACGHGTGSGWKHATTRLLPAVIATLSSSVAVAELGEALSACRGVTADEARLSCYDAIALDAPTASWSGANGSETFPVAVDGPASLRIRHDDAVLVGSLNTPDGELLRNLHLAGPGTLRTLISESGSYIVTISATGRWDARLDADPSNNTGTP